MHIERRTHIRIIEMKGEVVGRYIRFNEDDGSFKFMD